MHAVQQAHYGKLCNYNSTNPAITTKKRSCIPAYTLKTLAEECFRDFNVSCFKKIRKQKL